MNDATILAELRRCTAALATTGQPAAIYAAVEAALKSLIGHKLFTLLVVDGDEVARIHSSNPAAYKVSGRKPMNRTPWGDHVIKQRKIWIARNAEDIKWAFFDHALIHSLGCDSCVNVPVVYDDIFIGTINVLHEANWFDEAKAAAIAAFVPLVIAPYLQSARPKG